MLNTPIITRTRAAFAAALLSLAAATAAQAAPPAVLSELPADAKAVIVINNVKDLGTKVSNAAVRLNITLPPDLAGYVTRLVGITSGFDATGSAALAMLAQNPEQAEEAGPPQMIALLPATDPKAIMKSFQPGDSDKAGISEVTLPGDRGEKGYVATVDKWVAIAQDRAALEKYLARKNSLDKTLSPESLKVFEANDVVIWANIPTLTKGVDQLLEDAQQKITGNMDLVNLKLEQDPMVAALQKAAINEYFLAAKQYLKDASSAMVTLRLSDPGATLGLVASFRPDSPFGKFVAAQKPTHPLTLQGLPNGDFWAAFITTWNPQSVSALVGDIQKRILSDEVIAKTPNAPKLGQLFEQYQQIIALTTGASLVMLEPAPGSGAKNSLFSGAYIVESTDPEKLRTQQLELLNNPMMHQLMGSDIKQDIKVTPDAVTIKSTRLTKIHQTFNLREETPDKPVSEVAKKQIEMIHKLYGADGLTMYTAVVNKHLLIIMGSDPGILEASVAAAETNSNDLANNAAITASKDQVVPNAVTVAYLSTGRLLNIIQSIAIPNAAPAPVQPGNPLVMSAGVAGSTLTMEMHVPTTTISAIKDFGTRMMQQMMNGGMGDNNGGGMQP